MHAASIIKGVAEDGEVRAVRVSLRSDPAAPRSGDPRQPRLRAESRSQRSACGATPRPPLSSQPRSEQGRGAPRPRSPGSIATWMSEPVIMRIAWLQLLGARGGRMRSVVTATGRRVRVDHASV
jgi:hypothetical protein